MSWASQRKLLYSSIVFIVLGSLIAFFLISFFSEKPTCFDGKKNGDELDIDCGGSCSKFCLSQTLPPIIIWQRVLRISSGVYSAVAYVENPNLGMIAFNVPYSFRVYDEKNILIIEKTGTTFIPSKKIFPVYEASVGVGERTPFRVVYQFLEKPHWQKQIKEEPNVQITDKILTKEDTFPKLTASIKNLTIEKILSFDVVAILFDKDDNVVSFGKTVVDDLLKDASANIVFTWREPFGIPISKIEIIPRLQIN